MNCRRLDDGLDVVQRPIGSARRARISCPSQLNRLVKIRGIELRTGTRLCDKAVVPQSCNLNIVFATKSLVDRLQAMACDGPLSTEPVDVAMQGHGPAVPRTLLPQANKIPGRSAFVW